MAPSWLSWNSSSKPKLSFGSSSTAEDVTYGIDASDRTAIVTGASSGLGAETARVLALRGAQVVLAVRNETAGQKVKDSILSENPSARLHVLQIDLSSMESVRKFAQNFKALNLPLNILINNAAIMACPFALSTDGIELQFATNHVGHFLLTSLLLDTMKKTAKETGIQGRIVTVSSYGHQLYKYPGGIRFDKLNDQSSYAPWHAYGQSKLANILHAKELARRFEKEQVNMVANTLHPGLIQTNLSKHNKTLQFVEKVVGRFFWKSIPQGAATQCLLALHPSINNTSGEYYADCTLSKPSEEACDAKLAKDLWDFTEKFTS